MPEEEKTAAVMETGTEDDEQSVPVKERRRSREKPRRGKSGGRGEKRERKRERERPDRNNGRIILPGYFSK